jgi:3-oxoacyl-[acyl-carrier protein] reductase
MPRVTRVPRRSKGHLVNQFGAPPLAGQVAIVTGAGSANGIGFASARLLSALGASVVLSGLSGRVLERSSELVSEGATSIARVGDLTMPAQANALVDLALSTHGRIDILVNNAGMTSAQSPSASAGIADITDEEWSSALDRNLNSALFVTRPCSAVMVDQGYGRIVTVSSVSGPVAAYGADVGYHAAKAALVGFTRSIALDLAPHGITANAVAPGWIQTESSTPEEIEHGRHTPVGRPGTAAEVASVIAYLASPESSYLTGQIIVIDGGNSIQEVRG